MFATAMSGPQSRMRSLLVGGLAAALAWALRFSFSPFLQDESPYITIVMMAAVVTTYRGFACGLVVVVIGGLAANFSFVGHPDQFDFSGRYRSEFLFLIIAGGSALYLIDGAMQRDSLLLAEPSSPSVRPIDSAVTRKLLSKPKHMVLDIVLSAFSIVFSPVLYVIARKRWALRSTRAIHDAIGITIVRNHYYEPVFTDADLRVPSDSIRDLPGVHFDLPGQLATLDRFHFAAELASLDGSDVNGHFYRYENRMFGEGDADALYSFVRAYKPETVIEIGCGHSSIVIELALRRNVHERPYNIIRHICLEPFHNQWLQGLGVDFRPQRVEDADLAMFESLKPNDIVFIDSSHVLKSQGDVEHIFLRVLPLLPVGVIVHFHDIFTPFDYSNKFLREDRRFWTEQYMLEAFLTCNEDFRVLLALNHLHASRQPRLYEALPILAQCPNANPGSFWIQRVAATRTQPPPERRRKRSMLVDGHCAAPPTAPLRSAHQPESGPSRLVCVRNI